MIICFEGAPAVGKSTVAAEFAKDSNSYVIPEVNQLFGKNNRISNLWYYEKQVERFSIGLEQQGHHRLVVLDGDIFQPLWFRWVFSNEDWGDNEEMLSFYRSKIANKHIQFPDVYIYLHISEEERARREYQRCMTQRRSEYSTQVKVDRYKKLAVYMKHYFRALSVRFPGLVVSMESNSISNCLQSIKKLPIGEGYSQISIFEHIVKWCRENKVIKLN